MVSSCLLSLAFAVEPLQPLTLLPDSLALPAVLDVCTAAVLLALLPVADVLTSIRPLEGAMAVFLIVHVLADVLAAIGPGEGACALHLVVDPLAVVDAAVRPDVFANAMDVVLVELAVVRALVRPDKFTAAMLHSVLIIALVLGAIRPLLDAVAMLLVLLPGALVTTTVEVRIHTVAIGLVVGPLTLVHVAFRVHQTSEPIGHAVLPESVVAGAIRPDLHAATVLLVGADKPLTLIHGAVLEDLDRPDDALFGFVDVIDGPVKRLQLIDDLLIKLEKAQIFESYLTYQHDGVVVSRIEDLQVLVHEHLKSLVRPIGHPILALTRFTAQVRRQLEIATSVLFGNIATGSHIF